MYYLKKYYDNQSITSNNAYVNFDADVQKREELSVQPIPDASSRNAQKSPINGLHSNHLFGDSNQHRE